MSRKCILKQLSSQGSTAQNGHKWLKTQKKFIFLISSIFHPVLETTGPAYPQFHFFSKPSQESKINTHIYHSAEPQDQRTLCRVVILKSRFFIYPYVYKRTSVHTGPAYTKSKFRYISAVFHFFSKPSRGSNMNPHIYHSAEPQGQRTLCRVVILIFHICV